MLIRTSGRREARLSDFAQEAGPNLWNAIAAGLAGGLSNAFISQYDTATFASSATPAVTVNLRDALADGPPNPYAQWLKPTLVLSGPAGRQVIAPYGPSSGSVGGPLLLVLGIFGAGFVFGRLT